MPTRIADLRPKISNLDDADGIMSLISERQCALAIVTARAEKRILAIKQNVAAETAPLAAEIDALEQSLSAYIQANPEHFVKPRQRKCSYGTYGLRTVTEVDITDDASCLKHVVSSHLTDCYKTVMSLIRSGLESRLKAGENIPGCRLKTGDTATYKIAKSLIDEAVEKAVPS